MIKKGTIGRYIVSHKGFNREQRRHDSSTQLYIEEGMRTGHPVPKNKPYEKN